MTASISDTPSLTQCPSSPSTASLMTPCSEIDDTMSILSMTEVEQDASATAIAIAPVEQHVSKADLSTIEREQDVSQSTLTAVDTVQDVTLPNLTTLESSQDVSKHNIETIILHPSGDIYISSLSSPTTHFLCSSAFLSQISPLLNTLIRFSPSYLELPVPLPTLTRLLRMIHHRPDPSLSDPDPESIYALARACDTYGCANIFAPHVRYSFRAVAPTWSFRQTSYMLAAAALFRLPGAFREISRALVWRYGESLAQISEECPSEEDRWVHPKAIYHMDLQRREARLRIHNVLSQVHPVPFSCGCLPDKDGNALKSAYRVLLVCPLTSAVGAVEAYLRGSVWPTGACRMHSKAKARSYEWESTHVIAGLQRVESVATGLCLDCYLAGRKEMGSCTEDHEMLPMV